MLLPALRVRLAPADPQVEQDLADRLAGAVADAEAARDELGDELASAQALSASVLDATDAEVYVSRAEAETAAGALAAGDRVRVARDESQAGEPTNQLYSVADPAAPEGQRLALAADLSPSNEVARRVPVAAEPSAEGALGGHVPVVVGGAITRARVVDLDGGLNLLRENLGLRIEPAVDLADAAEHGRADQNVAVFNQLSQVAADHNVPVILPAQASGAPYPWRGTMVVHKELVGTNGRPVLKIPDGALVDGFKENGLRPASGLNRCEIRNVEVDGNAANNRTDYVIGRVGADNARIAGGFEGVAWGGRPLPGEDVYVPPRSLVLVGVSAHDVFGSCFVGSGSGLQMTDCEGGNSECDHVLYLTDAQNGSPDGTATSEGASVKGLHVFGYWRGSALDVTGGYVEAFFSDVVPNPAVVKATNVLGYLAGARSYKQPTTFVVNGRLDLSLLHGLTAHGHNGHSFDFSLQHTGAADLPTEVDGVPLNGTPLIGQSGDDCYYGRERRWARYRVSITDAPGGVYLFDTSSRHTPGGAEIEGNVDFHAEATRSNPAVVMKGGTAQVRSDVNSRAGLRGGGFGGLASFHKGTATVLPVRHQRLEFDGDVEIVNNVAKDFHPGDHDVRVFALGGTVRMNKRGWLEGGLAGQATGSEAAVVRVPTNPATIQTYTVPFEVSNSDEHGRGLVESVDGDGVKTLTDRLVVAHTLGQTPDRVAVEIVDAAGLPIYYEYDDPQNPVEGQGSKTAVDDTYGHVLHAQRGVSAVTVGWDPQSFYDATDGASAFLRVTVERYEERRLVVDREVKLTTQAGVLVYDVPVNLIARPSRVSVHLSGTTTAVPVTASTRDKLTVTFGSDPGAGTVLLHVVAKAAATV